MLFDITIEELVSENFSVEANTYEEAVNIAKEKYNNGEIVLAPGSLVAKRIAVSKDDGFEWVEF